MAVLASAAAVMEVTVGRSGSHRDPPKRVVPDWVSDRAIAYLTITVTDPGGAIRTATLECGPKNKGSGYLQTIGSAAFACETVLINPTVTDYLTGRNVSGPSCTKTFDPAPPALVVRFEGAISENRVNRMLDVANDRCGEALAVIMFPLLESTAQNPSLGGL